MVTWLYPGLYCAFVRLFIVFLKADRFDKCGAWATILARGRTCRTSIWWWRKVRRERWLHPGRSDSFTETQSCGPPTWNSWSVTLWSMMWSPQGSNALSYWVAVAPPRTAWFGVWTCEASLQMSLIRTWWRKSRHTMPQDCLEIQVQLALTRGPLQRMCLSYRNFQNFVSMVRL